MSAAMELSLGAVLPQAEIQPSKPRDVRLLVGALSASVVGLGCNQFGATCDAGEAARLVAAALECGIDFLDVADGGSR